MMKKSKRRGFTSDSVGSLDKRLEIFKSTDDSEDGWANTSEVIFHSCWAELVEYKESDYQLAVQAGTNHQLRFRIRYKAGIETNMSVMYNQKRYSVVDKIGEDSRKPYMMIVLERKNL